MADADEGIPLALKLFINHQKSYLFFIVNLKLILDFEPLELCDDKTLFKKK